MDFNVTHLGLETAVFEHYNCEMKLDSVGSDLFRKIYQLAPLCVQEKGLRSHFISQVL